MSDHPDSEVTGARLAWRENSVTRFNRGYRDKFDRGQREHGGTFVEKPGMLANAKAETFDLWAYQDAMDHQLALLSAQLRAGSISPFEAAEAIDRLRG